MSDPGDSSDPNAECVELGFGEVDFDEVNTHITVDFDEVNTHITHTHTYTHARARTHARTHACTHAHARTHTHTCTHTQCCQLTTNLHCHC